MKGSLKIDLCFLINGFGEGGAQKQCIILLNELQKDPQFNITLIHFFEGVYFPKLNKKNLTITKLNKSSFYDPRNILKIHKSLPQKKNLIVFSWMRSSDFYAYFLTKLNKNLIWVLAERNSNYPLSLFFKIRSFMGLKAHSIICNSQQGLNYWKKRGAETQKLTVIPNIIDAKRSNQNPPKEMKQKTIIYAGRFEPQKNIINTTRAFCNLVSENVKILLIGSGSLEEEIKNIIREKKAEHIEILPFKKNIMDYFCHLELFVSISNYEGMPNTVLENAYLKNKILLSKIPEHTNILGENYPLYVENNENIDEITNKLRVALNLDKKNIDFSHFHNVSKSMDLIEVVKLYKVEFIKVAKV